MKLIYQFLALVATLSLTANTWAEERERPRPQVFRGELTSIQDSSIRVTMRKEKSETTKSFDLNPKTVIQREIDEDETFGTSESGRQLVRPKRVMATAADLQMGQQVIVNFHEGQPAHEVLVIRAKRKEDREGDRKEPKSVPKLKSEGEKDKNNPEAGSKSPERDKEGKRETSRGEEQKPRPSESSRDEAHSEKRVLTNSLEPSNAKPTGLKLPNTGLVKSKASGNWSSPETWEGEKVPSIGNQVLIREGHQIQYDVVSEDTIRSLHVSGTLTFAPDKNTLLNVGLIRVQPGNQVIDEGFDCDHVAEEQKGAADLQDAGQPGFSAICVCCQSKSALLVGTPERPIDVNHQAVIRLHYIEGMNPKSCPAIVACGGRMDFHGAPLSRTWVKLGATADRGAAEIVLSESVSGWRAGDQIIITTSAGPQYGKGGTEEATIKSIAGTRIQLEQPLVTSHAGEGDYRAEVANLTRNVVVESATPDGVRGHTMYHVGSSGSVSYAEFRHLGKRDVLGRYNLHFHLCGDSMRGSSIVGASFHHSHNRWLTVHGTNYLVVRDCVGYQSIGHGFFLEDGTEVYNVFDRNLACQAMIGRPLPKQILPYDKNDGAGFWFANAHNTFTRNVGVECGQYGFRFDASPKAGTVVDGQMYGSPKEEFTLVMAIRQPDGSRQSRDIRTLPFVRFEDNESHSNGKWGLNLGQHSGGQVGPDPATPFVVRNMKIWQVIGGWGVEVPNVLVDGMTIHDTQYGVRESAYVAQDYRNFVFTKIRGHINVSNTEDYFQARTTKEGNRRTRLPGWPQGVGDGGPNFQAAEIETAKLNPIDKLPPITVITETRRAGSQLLIRGTTSDDGNIKDVTVNGQPVRAVSPNYKQWEINLPVSGTTVELMAKSTDDAGNVEQTPHVLTLLLKN